MYLTIDVETGGIGKDKSLLTAYFGMLDENFKLVDGLLLHTKPNDGIYAITAEALTINGIDLIAHDKMAMTETQAAPVLYEWLKKHSNSGAIKLIPVGHNVHFDIDFIVSKLINKKTWDKFVTYRTLDTGTVGLFLMKAGLIPEISASLGSLAKHFGVEFKAHTADGDALATAECMKRMLDLARKKHDADSVFVTPPLHC